MQWYYVKDGGQQGPVDEQKILSMLSDGSLKGDDLVWNETFDEKWLPAGTVPEFKKAAADKASESAPPDLPQHVKELRYEKKPEGISITSVIEPAFQRMKDILFRPFDMAKWFALGVSAFLATLGQGGGSGSSGGGNSSSSSPGDFDVDAVITTCKEFITENAWIIPLALGIVALGIVLGVICAWLKARGQFMFLDNVATNRARISEPWNEYKQQGNSLFFWSIGYGLVCLLIFSIIASIAFFAIIKPCYDASAFVPTVIPSIVFVIIVSILFGIISAYITRFLEDFVVPIMYKQKLSATQAWGSFLTLMKPCKGGFLLYGLFYAVLMGAAGIAVMLLVLLTCCIALCPLSIPYIGSVIILPMTVFFRAYSLEYLAQYGKEYDVFNIS